MYLKIVLKIADSREAMWAGVLSFWYYFKNSFFLMFMV